MSATGQMESKAVCYARRERWAGIFYRAALICGLVPLILGISVFRLWQAAEWPWLMAAGALTIYGGVAIFAFGIFALVLYCWLAFRTPQLARRRVWKATLACVGLLLLNFPVAGGIMIAVTKIVSRYTVLVHNAREQPVQGIRISGCGNDLTLDPIPPGGAARKTFRIQEEGQLLILVPRGATIQTAVIEGYLIRNFGGRATVRINPDGTISVTSKAFL